MNSIYKVKIHKQVKFDIREGIKYYSKISKKLATVFALQIEIGKNFISEFPYANDIMYGENIRLYLLKNFPYHIHYLINEENKQIIILAVIFAKKGILNVSERI